VHDTRCAAAGAEVDAAARQILRSGMSGLRATSLPVPFYTGERTRVLHLTAGKICALLCALAAPQVARAHVCMDTPASRVGAGCSFSSPQKVGPCGVDERGTKPTEFRPGETITVSLNETIDHPSHYRIAFNPDGDAFEDPTSKDDKTGGHPFVLLDNIVDESAAKQSVKVTLPNITCERCTLQLIQVMYDKGGNGFGGNDGVAPDNDDLYYACADVVLKGEPVAGAPAAADAGPVGQDAGGAGSPEGGLPKADAGVAVGKRDASVSIPAPSEDKPSAQRDAGTPKDAAVSSDEPDPTSPAKGDQGCSLAGAGTSPLAGASWLAFAVVGQLWRRRRAGRG